MNERLEIHKDGSIIFIYKNKISAIIFNKYNADDMLPTIESIDIYIENDSTPFQFTDVKTLCYIDKELMLNIRELKLRNIS